MNKSINSIEKENVWESLCHACGKCCYEKHNLGIAVIIDPERPCKYLVDRKCSIYNERFSINPDCGDIKGYAILVDGVLPSDCGYIHLREGYIPAIFPRDMNHFWECIALIETELNNNYELISENKVITDIKTFVINRREEHDE